MRTYRSPSSAVGFSMLEVLISIVIVAISLLGLAGLQARAHNAEFESYQREQALNIAQSMVESIRATRGDSASYRSITNSATGQPYLGTLNGATDANHFDCHSATNPRAESVLCAWDAVLAGAGETVTTAGVTSNVGSIIAARGCIIYDSSIELSPSDGTGRYTVIVSWQGSTRSAPPVDVNLVPINCGNNTYTPDENFRRAVALTFSLPKLN